MGLKFRLYQTMSESFVNCMHHWLPGGVLQGFEEDCAIQSSLSGLEEDLSWLGQLHHECLSNGNLAHIHRPKCHFDVASYKADLSGVSLDQSEYYP